MRRNDPERLAAIAERRFAIATGRADKELTSIYKEVRENIRARLDDAYNRFAINGVLTEEQLAKYGRLTRLERDLNQLVGEGTQKARAAIVRNERAIFNEALENYRWQVEMQIGARIPWGRVPADTVQAAIRTPLAEIAMERLRTTSRERIRRALAQGIIQGQSFHQLATAVGQQINGNRSDAMRIARTEMHRVQNEASLVNHERLEKLGIKSTKVWVSVEDQRTRQDHDKMNGVEADEDGIFTLPSGASGPAPGLTGEAADDINCRCTWYERIDDAPDDLPEQEYMSFDRWRASR